VKAGQLKQFSYYSDRKWVPPGLYNLMENPPKSPVFKGGLSKGFHKVPPFDKGGLGGISIRGQVKTVIY
jgi:hypothetical protein